jgi:hypothetical protein
LACFCTSKASNLGFGIYLEGPGEKVAEALASKTLALAHRPFDLEDKVAEARLEGARFRQAWSSEFVDALELMLH